MRVSLADAAAALALPSIYAQSRRLSARCALEGPSYLPTYLPTYLRSPAMSLHLLHTKSWHVWNQDNLDRVARDEAAAAASEAAARTRGLAVEAEARVERLRARAALQGGGSAAAAAAEEEEEAAPLALDTAVVARKDAVHPEHEAERVAGLSRARRAAGLPEDTTFRDVVAARPAWYALPAGSAVAAAAAAASSGSRGRPDAAARAASRARADGAAKEAMDPLAAVRDAVGRTQQLEQSRAAVAPIFGEAEAAHYYSAAHYASGPSASTAHRSPSSTPLSYLLAPLRAAEALAGEAEEVAEQEEAGRHRHRRRRRHGRGEAAADDDTAAVEERGDSHRRHRRRRSRSRSRARESPPAVAMPPPPALAEGELAALRVQRLVREATERERTYAMLAVDLHGGGARR